MLQVLKTIGEYAQATSNEGFLTQLVDNPNTNGQYENVLLIKFNNEDNEINFTGIDVEEFDPIKLDKYAYKYGSPRGGDLTPTSKITDLAKTFQRIQSPLKKVADQLEGKNSSEESIIQIYQLLENEEIGNEIYEQLEKTHNSIEGKAILTIVFQEDNKQKYVGDFKEFTDSLITRYEKKFYHRNSYNKEDREAIGYNNKCYICSRTVEKTYGYVGTYSFYTLDKPGFTSGGFKRGEAWKNYPVCPECAKILDLGKDYLEENLSSRFCGIDYAIIPKTIFATEESDNEDIFNTLEFLEQHRKMSLKEDARQRLTATQNELFELMKDFKNYINFNLMFYEEQNSAFRILLYVEDVLPSYIQEIFKAKEQVDEEDLFRDLVGKDGEIFSMKFMFDYLENFFYVNRTNKPDYTKQFLEITGNILSRQNISYHLLIDRFVDHIQEKFRKREPHWFDNLKAIMILKFLIKLNLLSDMREGADKLATESTNLFRENIQNFLDKHSDVLNTNEKITAFLEGVLVQKLLNIQKNKTGGAAPFQNRLNGLKLNKKIVRRIYSEAINKLEEYGSNYYKQLEEMIADYILESDFEEISNNELSFYFVTGMNQASKFNFENNIKGDENYDHS